MWLGQTLSSGTWRYSCEETGLFLFDFFLFLCSVCHSPRSDNIPLTSTSRMKSSRETRMSGKISDGVKQSVFVMRYSTAVWLCVHVCRCHGFRCLCACDVRLCLRGVCLCLCGMLTLK